MPTDLELLDAWRGGDRHAGHVLFERYFSCVSRFFHNKVPEEREDLIQRTFLACVESRQRLRDNSNFRAYVLKIARNELYSYLVRRYRVLGDPGETAAAELETSPSRIVARNAEHALLLRALRCIPIELQMALELCYWEDLGTTELAFVLGIPSGTVKSRLHRARKLLRERMAELAESPNLLKSTLDNLEHWASSMREFHTKTLEPNDPMVDLDLGGNT